MPLPLFVNLRLQLVLFKPRIERHNSLDWNKIASKMPSSTKLEIHNSLNWNKVESNISSSTTLLSLTLNDLAHEMFKTS